MSKQHLLTTGRKNGQVLFPQFILRLITLLAIVTCQAAKLAAADSMLTGNVVANWTFSRSEDTDFDDWPEGWQRKRDRDHPAYLPMKIVAHNENLLNLARSADLKVLRNWSSLQGKFPTLPALPPSIADRVVGRYLRIDLDGGWAMIQSRSVPVDPLYRYRLELLAKSESLVFDKAYAELVFLGPKGELIAKHETKSLTGTTAWKPLTSDLVAVPNNTAKVAVRLLIRSQKVGGETDITGAAGFDNITIRRLPQMQISTDQRLALYDVGQKPTITVRVLGLDRHAESVQFVLRDVNGAQIAAQRVAFEEANHIHAAEPIGSQNNPALSKPIGQSSAETSIEGVANWQVPELKPGFYIIQSLLGDKTHPSLSSETTFAILADLPATKTPSPYGWTLPRDETNDLDMKRIPDWLYRLGVGVVKYPCWFAPDDRVRLDAAAWLVGRLQEKEIRTIGLLDTPPESVRTVIDERERREPVAANLFRDSSVWQPMLEPIMTRLSLKVRTWQLGSNNDYSFLGRPKIKQTIKDISRDLQGFGQPIGIAISWPWLEPLPPATEKSWAAVNLSTSSSAPLAADELDAYLQTIETTEPGARDQGETWVMLDPLDASAYDRDTRITDLVSRMMTVRGYRVSGAFITNPLDRNRGLLRPDWRPDELLLPWRTTAALLGDLKKVGSLPMGNGSSTVVLANATRTNIVVWNPTPTTEAVYVGDSMRQIDVWGNSTIPKKELIDGKTVYKIKVGPIPTFLIDVDPVLVAFRMATRLKETSLDSLLGRRQSVTIEFTNPTTETLSGEVRMKQRSDWEIDARPQAFDLAGGRSAVQTFDVSLRNSAKIGEAALEFDFMLRTQPPRRFTVTRSLHVGPDGLDIEITTRLVGDDLQVLLTMANQTQQPQQYDCMLFPPGGRQYQRRQINIPAETSVKRTFPWSGGAALIGETMMLRAVEQNGDRVLNQVINVTP